MTLNILPGRYFRGNSNVPDTQQGANVLSWELIKINGTWRAKVPYTKSGQGFNAALGNGAAVTIATVTALNVPVVAYLDFYSSIAGSISFRYNGVIFNTYIAVVNTPKQIAIPDGLLFSAVAGVFDVINNTGGASAVGGNIHYAEYVN